MEKIRCSFCGKDVAINEIYGLYPEDDSYICKNCVCIPEQRKTCRKRKPANRKNSFKP